MAKKLATLAADLERAVAECRAEAAGLVQRDAALRREREEVRRAPAPLEECIATLERLVDEEHRQAVRERGLGIVRDLSGGVRLPEGAREERVVAPVLPRVAPELSSGQLTIRDLCLVAPDLLKRGIAAVVREAGASHGLPAEARTKRLEALDAELAAIEEQHEALRATAAAVGIAIEELPAVRARRLEAEGREAARWVPVVAGVRA